LNVREREYRCLCSYYVTNIYASLMYELKKKLENYLRVNLLGPGPSSYKKIIYRDAVSQRLRNTVLYNFISNISHSKRNSWRFFFIMCIGRHVKYQLILSDFNETCISSTDFTKNLKCHIP
jgi:hypothetical protein